MASLTGRASCSRPPRAQRHVGGPGRPGAAAGELVFDQRVHLIEPEVERFDPGRPDLAHERSPELATVEGALDARQERVDRFGMLGVASPLVSAEPLQRVLEVPLAEIDLALGP
jgi:hypothetical protein